MTAASPSPSSPLEWHHLGAFRGRQNRFLGAALGEHGDPVFDEVGRVAVDLHPRQAVPKNPAMGQRALSANAGAKIAKAALKSEHLPQSFHITTRKWERAHARDRWPASA